MSKTKQYQHRLNTKHLSLGLILNRLIDICLILVRSLYSVYMVLSWSRLIMILNLTVLVCLIGCAVKRSHVLLVDASFASYLTAFEVSAKIQGKTLKVDNLIMIPDDGSLSQNEIGRCTLSSGETPLIRINMGFWASASIWDRRELIFHELGHCILGLTHNDTLYYGGAAVSIMHTTHLGMSQYGPNTYSQYETQLFNSTPHPSLVALLSTVSK